MGRGEREEVGRGGTSVSWFKFHKSKCPLPSAVANSAGWVGDHLAS
jgi:hypothetical protein